MGVGGCFNWFEWLRNADSASDISELVALDLMALEAWGFDTQWRHISEESALRAGFDAELFRYSAFERLEGGSFPRIGSVLRPYGLQTGQPEDRSRIRSCHFSDQSGHVGRIHQGKLQPIRCRDIPPRMDQIRIRLGGGGDRYVYAAMTGVPTAGQDHHPKHVSRTFGCYREPLTADVGNLSTKGNPHHARPGEQ
ncbi:protein of unknown function [Magnetospirillum sp. XM-1]|nr:protein of unknown function [Magnetospirillum sp. XM-1]